MMQKNTIRKIKKPDPRSIKSNAGLDLLPEAVALLCHMSDRLSPQTLLRYSRQIRLPDIGTSGQEKLLRARVLLIGAGALGSPAAMYLAAGGVGTLGLADFDSVETHNLQRQIIHSDAAVGTSKLESASNTLRGINPQVKLELHPQGITASNAVELIRAYDLVIDGSDNFPTRFMVNDAAFFARRPLVYGSIFQFEGQLSVFDASKGKSPCYRCLFPEMPPPGLIPNCEEGGVFGALPGVIGSFQAIEAIKLITGVGQPLIGRLFVVDALNQRNRYITLKKDADCPLCGSAPRISDIHPDTYNWHCISQKQTGDTNGTDAPSATAAVANSAAATTVASADATSPADSATTRDSAINADLTNTASADPNVADLTTLPIEISPVQAQAYLARTDAVLIDVREPFEYEIGHIENARLIPLRTLADSAKVLPKDCPLIIYCHLGMRSLHAAQFLRQHGFNGASSILGGIDSWSTQIDPTIPRY